MVPDRRRDEIADMVKGAKYVVISLLRNISASTPGIVGEFMIDDGSGAPWAFHFGVGSFDMLPKPGEDWEAAIWGRKNLVPHRFMQRKAFVRYVNALPCCKPYDPAVDAVQVPKPVATASSQPNPSQSVPLEAIRATVSEIIADMLADTPVGHQPEAAIPIFKTDADYEANQVMVGSHAHYKTFVRELLAMAPSRGLSILLREYRDDMFDLWKADHSRGDPELDFRTFLSDTNYALRSKRIAAHAIGHDTSYEQDFHAHQGNESCLMALTAAEIQIARYLLNSVENCIYAREFLPVASKAGLFVRLTGLGDPAVHEQMKRRCPKLADSEIIVCLEKPSMGISYYAGTVQDIRDSLFAIEEKFKRLGANAA